MNSERKPVRDRDVAEQVQWLNIIWFAVVAGLAAGAAIGFFLFRWPPLRGAFILGGPCGLVAFGVMYIVVEGSGSLLGRLHEPAGIPRRRELSREQALIVAERYEEAAEALVAAHERDPEDVRPAQMLAELYRDRLDDPDEAVRWYRRAAAAPGIAIDTERLLLREMVEMCSRLDRPELAAPALARAAQLHSGDRLGHWARLRLKEIKGRDGAMPRARPGRPDP